ncbi:uncharacterized protein FIBRA_03126 [Fibroporia radiculosa]|uniref:Uncharacterized protein n=1 Tax=Fibroporia radiculosa TaxID=599839 RepID=J4G496_9APHY|nr:uncharacterized protein FIBRA_03126 [Fibroporia radiculosa]CCM01078.1 predicted protein [Fibroporia radiculosa]
MFDNFDLTASASVYSHDGHKPQCYEGLPLGVYSDAASHGSALDPSYLDNLVWTGLCSANPDELAGYQPDLGQALHVLRDSSTLDSLISPHVDNTLQLDLGVGLESHGNGSSYLVSSSSSTSFHTIPSYFPLQSTELCPDNLDHFAASQTEAPIPLTYAPRMQHIDLPDLPKHEFRLFGAPTQGGNDGARASTSHASPAFSRPSTPSGNSRSHSRRVVRPRNAQAFISPLAAAQALANGSFVCPAPGCGHVPSSKNPSDLERHMATHQSYANKGKWICCGIPANAENADVAYIIKGRLMTGGCQTEFSRKDSLGRHLTRSGCVGDLNLAQELGSA